MITQNTLEQLKKAIQNCNEAELTRLHTDIKDTLKELDTIHTILIYTVVPNIGQKSYDIITTKNQIHYNIQETCEIILNLNKRN